MTCTRLRIARRRLICGLVDEIIQESACATCTEIALLPETKPIKKHPRAKVRPLPLRPGEASWLQSLGVPVRK